jgi:hypothetical protein
MANKRRKVIRKDQKKALSASQGQAKQGKEERIRFDYIKSNCFRVIRVDGVSGSPTPKADGIQIALFSERLPIPKSEEYLLGSDGTLGKRTKIDARSAIVREVEVEAILSVRVARSLCTWLEQKIRRAEEIAARSSSNGK